VRERARVQHKVDVDEAMISSTTKSAQGNHSHVTVVTHRSRIQDRLRPSHPDLGLPKEAPHERRIANEY
jgi:hypothetical protein